jgi:hypothetical protein
LTNISTNFYCLLKFVRAIKIHVVARMEVRHLFQNFNKLTKIQGVSRLVDITAGGDFLGFCDQKSSYKHVSDFGRLRSYGHFLIPAHALV